MKIDDTKLHRTELDDLPPLVLSIEGEAGWDVIPVDIVKNDVTTPQQEKTWKIREKRTDLNDPVVMEKRRMAIEEYFQRMYAERFTWASKRVVEYRGFADNLIKGEQVRKEVGQDLIDCSSKCSYNHYPFHIQSHQQAPQL